MRNSSLVKWCCAENVSGLESFTEATDFTLRRVVGEHPVAVEAAARAGVDVSGERMLA